MSLWLLGVRTSAGNGMKCKYEIDLDLKEILAILRASFGTKLTLEERQTLAMIVIRITKDD